jgi:hypothetical protein
MKASSGLTRILIVLSLIPATLSEGRGAEEFDYPELLVTPRASSRLESEAKREASDRRTRYLAIQASALTTLAAGAALQRNPGVTGGQARLVGIGVGAGWLALTTALAMKHAPYASASAEISAMPAKTRREQLARERAAESAIEATASLARRLQWLSVATNAAAGAYLLGESRDGSFSKSLNIGVIAMALAPVVFPQRAIRVACEQRDYKKRIYGPIAGATLLPGGPNGGLVPGMALSMSF